MHSLIMITALVVGGAGTKAPQMQVWYFNACVEMVTAQLSDGDNTQAFARGYCYSSSEKLMEPVKDDALRMEFRERCEVAVAEACDTEARREHGYGWCQGVASEFSLVEIKANAEQEFPAEWLTLARKQVTLEAETRGAVHCKAANAGGRR